MTTCRLCGREAGPAETLLGWSLATERDGTPSALCPACVRRHVRDIECRLDP